MGSKYGNRPAERDGIRFASLKERSTYDDLKLLEYSGQITRLRCQPRYELQPAFQRDGRTIRAVEYVGDFEYQEGEQTVCLDAKGVQTAVFKLKWKLVQYRYPLIQFRLV